MWLQVTIVELVMGSSILDSTMVEEVVKPTTILMVHLPKLVCVCVCVCVVCVCVCACVRACGVLCGVLPSRHHCMSTGCLSCLLYT